MLSAQPSLCARLSRTIGIMLVFIVVALPIGGRAFWPVAPAAPEVTP
jgi:hypothetical protein